MFTGVSIVWARRGFRVAAALLVAALLVALFLGGAQPAAVGLVPMPWDKLAHAAVFAVLAICVGFACGLRGRPMFVLSFFVATGAGAIDEWHQIYLPGRGADWVDLAFDAAGAALGSAALSWRNRVETWIFKHF